MRVLLAEDDVSVRETLVDLLAEAGHAATAVGSYAEARALLETPAWDVLLVDLVLPGGSGLDLAEHARARGLGAVLCSGHPNSIERVRERGIVLLVKPFSARELDLALAAVAPPSLH